MTNQFATYRQEFEESVELLASTEVAAGANQDSAVYDNKTEKRTLIRVQVEATYDATVDGDQTIQVLHSVDGGVTYDTAAIDADSHTLAAPTGAGAVRTSFIVSETANFKINVANGNSAAVDVVITAAPMVWRQMTGDGKVDFEND